MCKKIFIQLYLKIIIEKKSNIYKYFLLKTDLFSFFVLNEIYKLVLELIKIYLLK